MKTVYFAALLAVCQRPLERLYIVQLSRLNSGKKYGMSLFVSCSNEAKGMHDLQSVDKSLETNGIIFSSNQKPISF